MSDLEKSSNRLKLAKDVYEKEKENRYNVLKSYLKYSLTYLQEYFRLKYSDGRYWYDEECKEFCFTHATDYDDDDIPYDIDKLLLELTGKKFELKEEDTSSSFAGRSALTSPVPGRSKYTFKSVYSETYKLVE